MDEDSSMEQKTWQVYSFGKRSVFRLHLSESRDGFCWRGSKVNMVLNIHRNRKVYSGWREGGMEIIYLLLHCHHQNDFCIKVGSDESRFNGS